MTESTIERWLTEFSELAPEELGSHYSKVVQDPDLVEAIYMYFEDVHKYHKVVNNVEVCSVLFKYYKVNDKKLKRFTLQFLPQIIYTYLNAVAHEDKKVSQVVEALITGMYNLEIVDENGHPKITSFRLPSIAQMSIYHEPVSLAPASLTEGALRRLELRDKQLVRRGPLKPVDKLIARNRLRVLTDLLFCYREHISHLPKESLLCFCKITSRLVTQGFPKSGSSNAEMYRRSSVCSSSDESVPLVLPRIQLSQLFLSRILQCLYFTLFNGCRYESLQAIEDVYERGSYQCYKEVLLLGNAIRNCASSLPPGVPEDIPVGVNVTVGTTATTTTTTAIATLSKSMITNASFRTKKLPDDIPIIPDEKGVEIRNPSAVVLSSIVEEKEDATTPETHHRKSIPKMAATIGKKTKEKIATAVKSVHRSNSVTMNGVAEVSEDESGIELSSDISNHGNTDEADSTSPVNGRKTVPSNNPSLDNESSKSIQTHL